MEKGIQIFFFKINENEWRPTKYLTKVKKKQNSKICVIAGIIETNVGQ